MIGAYFRAGGLAAFTSGLTPHCFAACRWFHPFVERAVRAQVRPPVARGDAS